MVVVAAGPMGSSGAGAPGCGHPSGWAGARGPRGMEAAGPRGQRDQSGARPRRPGRGPDMGAITRCPRPGLLTLPPAPRDRRSGT